MKKKLNPVNTTVKEENITPNKTQAEFEKLIIDNEKFAYSVVNKEFSKYSWDIKKDLNSAALEGLVYAATKYDLNRSKECKFISYAIHWIRYYINEEIRKLYPVKLRLTSNTINVIHDNTITNLFLFVLSINSPRINSTPTIIKIPGSIL